MKENRKSSESRIRANMKYDAKWKKNYSIKFNRKFAPDIIEKMESVENKQDYITELIRADIAKNRPTVKETLDSIRQYKGYLPVQIYNTIDLAVVYADLEADGMTDEEAADMLTDRTWVKLCSDGVIVLGDVHDADFEWQGIHYTVKNDNWSFN